MVVLLILKLNFAEKKGNGAKRLMANGTIVFDNNKGELFEGNMELFGEKGSNRFVDFWRSGKIKFGNLFISLSVTKGLKD